MAHKPEGRRTRTGAPGIRPHGDKDWRIDVSHGFADDGERRRHTEVFTGTLAQAKARRAELLLRVERGPRLGTDPVALGELVERWFAQARLARSTQADYRSAIRCHLDPDPITIERIDLLRPSTITAFYERLRAKGLSDTRVQAVHGVISAALNWAVRQELVERNVAAAVPPPTGRDAEAVAPSSDELRQLMAAVDDDFSCYLRLSAILGARRSEVLALRWSQIDLDGGVVQIVGALTDLGKGFIATKGTKNDRTRRVSLTGATLEVLRRQRVARVEAALAAGVALHPDGFVFARSLDGTSPARPDSYTQRFIRLRDRLGLHHVQLKNLRHYAATEMLSAGVDPKTAAERLGHDPALMMRRYAHFVPARDREAADLLEAALSSPEPAGAPPHGPDAAPQRLRVPDVTPLHRNARHPEPSHG